MTNITCFCILPINLTEEQNPYQLSSVDENIIKRLADKYTTHLI